MSDDMHRQIGAALGFPSCCVEAWIADNRTQPRKPSAWVRGSIHPGTYRTARPEGLPEDWHPDLLTDDSEMYYVPCRKCIGGPDWRPWGYDSPDEARAADAAFA